MGVKFKSSIEHAQFEYTPETTGDRTQFDFYVKTEKGEEAFFEFKYSERGFGTPSNGSCNDIDFYAKLCRESVNLSGMAKMKVDDSVRKNFFSDLFQVWRNIGHVKNEKKVLCVCLSIQERDTFEAISKRKHETCTPN